MICYTCRTHRRVKSKLPLFRTPLLCLLSHYPPHPTLNLCLVQTMCDIHHVSGNDYDIQINSRGQRVCADIEGTKEAGEEEEEEEGGVSFINSPAVVETPCWTVNHQWPQNYRHGSPADSKNCLLTAIYGPASQAEPPLSLASPRCAHILTSSRHQLLLGLPAHWLTASCLKAAFPPAPRGFRRRCPN